MRDASLFHSGLHHGEQGYEHYWLFPEMLNAENVENAVSAIPIGSFASPNLARIDLGNDVFVAYDRRARDESEELPRAAPVTGCGPVWIPEAASCLTSKAPVNQKVDRWLVDTGCGCDLVSKEHTAAIRIWVRKAVHPRTFQTANGVTTT